MSLELRIRSVVANFNRELTSLLNVESVSIAVCSVLTSSTVVHL